MLKNDFIATFLDDILTWIKLIFKSEGIKYIKERATQWELKFKMWLKENYKIVSIIHNYLLDK